MQFTSIAFIVALAAFILIYYLVPNRLKNVLLLIVCYAFYAAFGFRYIFLLLGSTALTYFSGICFSENKGEKNRLLLVISIIVTAGILFIYKYLDFSISLFNRALAFAGIRGKLHLLQLVLPVGISFFIFKEISYLIDTYKGEMKAEKNFADYALYVSFFPTILSGPIDRAEKFIPQIKEEHAFDYEKVKTGILLMIWGYFLKLVISDRIYQFTGSAYTNYKEYSGVVLLIAVLLYSIQIYCDFCGYSCIARGMAAALGYRVMENFEQPYFATTIAEFWRRWHISLSSWLKDYIYIPLGGSRCGKSRRYFNLLLTFLVSGLWHGAGLSYVIWGLLHGFYQIIGKETLSLRKKWLEIIRVNQDSAVHKMVQRVVVYILVSFAWIFFAAASTRDALAILARIFGDFNIGSIAGNAFFEKAMGKADIHILIVSIVVLLIVDILKYRKIDIQGWIRQQHIIFRWVLYLVALFSIIIFGVYGIGYEASQFVYFQF